MPKQKESIHVDGVWYNGELFLKHSDLVNWLKLQSEELDGEDKEVIHHVVMAIVRAVNQLKNKNNHG